MSFRKRISKSGKLFLLNTINSVSNQNRVTEEKEMWDHHFTTKRLHSKTRYKEKPREFQRRTISEEKRIRPIIEDEDPDRWGHDGYRELYPNEFQVGNEKTSSLSESDGSERIKKHHKKHKKDKKHKSKKKHKKKPK